MPRTPNSRTGEGPYLTHVVSHHGQLTLIPPQNAGRVRKTSPPRSTRNLHLYDVASATPSTQRAKSPTTQTLTIRRPDLPQQDLTVPDFPPPSFQEAISDPVYRIPTTGSLSVTSFSTYHSLTPISPSDLSYPTTSASSPTDGSVYQDAVDGDAVGDDLTPPDSDDGGLEMVSLDASQTEWEEDRQQGLSLDDRVRREMERRRIAEGFHHPPPSVLSRQRTCSHCGASRIGDDERSIVAIPASSPTTDERVHIMPAPVARRRLLLGHKTSQSMSSASVPSTPVSARKRPSFDPIPPPSDPHRRSRSMSPTPRPSSPSSVVSAKPSLSFMSKRLFSSSKGKDRSAVEEPLEAWEVLDSAPAGSCQLPTPPPLSRLRRTLSKMSLANIGPLSSSLDSPRAPAIKPYPLQHTSVPQLPSEKHTPRVDLPPIQNRPVPPTPPTLQNRPMRSPPPVPPPLRTHSPLATHVYSPFSPFSTSSTLSPDTDLQRTSKGPPPPQPPSRRKVPSVSNAVTQGGMRQRYQSMSAPQASSKVLFPLISPTGTVSNFNGYRGHSFNTFPFTSSYAFRDSPSSSDLSYVTDHMEEPESKASSLLTVRPTAGDATVENLHTYAYPGSPTSPVSPSSTSPGSSRPPSRSGHHYPGRPLPHPPPGSPITATPITEIPFIFGDKKVPIPITSDPQNSGRPRYEIAYPHTQAPVITERLRGFSLAQASPSPPPSASTSQSSVVESEGYRERDGDVETVDSEVTDLDVLISRIDDSDQGGNYENLLLVSEVLGRGNGSPAEHKEQQQTRMDSTELTPFVGMVEVQRRRVMKDGRVKLKLTLLGVGVDKCGVCLSQFRDKECAALGPKCQHSYHERCLKRWLRRNEACPLCRVSLNQSEI